MTTQHTHAASLQNFQLTDLAPFTLEGSFAQNASRDFHLFYVGRDNVHELLRFLFSRATISIYLNMFGYDDDELNAILMQKVLDPRVTMLITLDKSQSKGKHEAALLAADRQHHLAAFNTHFTLGQSLTHQISHTKGFVLDGVVGGEGSTNWSASGEGTFAVKTWQHEPGAAAGPVHVGGSYKAQNNTQSVFVDADSVARFQAELIAEHMAARGQPGAVKDSSTASPATVGATGSGAGATH